MLALKSINVIVLNITAHFGVNNITSFVSDYIQKDKSLYYTATSNNNQNNLEGNKLERKVFQELSSLHLGKEQTPCTII